MNFARSLLRELVDKRLWPIAVVLVIALIAVPVLLTGGGGDSAETAPVSLPAAPGATDTAKAAAIELTGPPSVRSRPGKVQNPFRRAPGKPAASETAPAGDSAGEGAGASPSASGDSTAAPSGDTSTPTTTPAQSKPTTTPSTPTYYRTAVRWYAADPGKPFALQRLMALGGLADPGVLYLGATKSDAVYALFALGPNSTSEGEGKCEDQASCRIFGLKAGESQIVTTEPANGSPTRQFTLEAVVVKAVAATAAESRTMRAKVHPAGRDLMRELWKDAPTAAALAAVSYDPAAGLVVEAGATGSADKSSK